MGFKHLDIPYMSAWGYGSMRPAACCMAQLMPMLGRDWAGLEQAVFPKPCRLFKSCTASAESTAYNSSIVQLSLQPQSLLSSILLACKAFVPANLPCLISGCILLDHPPETLSQHDQSVRLQALHCETCSATGLQASATANIKSSAGFGSPCIR